MGARARARSCVCICVRACVMCLCGHMFVCACAIRGIKFAIFFIFLFFLFFLFCQQEKGIDDMHTERKPGAPAEKQNSKREISSECAGPQEELLKERREMSDYQ